MKLEWEAINGGEVAGDYRIDMTTARVVVYFGEKKIGSTTSAEIARAMAQHHADTDSAAMYR
jgi:hypothetical protein